MHTILTVLHYMQALYRSTVDGACSLTAMVFNPSTAKLHTAMVGNCNYVVMRHNWTVEGHQHMTPVAFSSATTAGQHFLSSTGISGHCGASVGDPRVITQLCEEIPVMAGGYYHAWQGLLTQLLMNHSCCNSQTWTHSLFRNSKLCRNRGHS